MDKQTPEKLAPHLVEPYKVLPVVGDASAFDVAGAIHGDEQWFYRVRLGKGERPDHCECDGMKYRGTCAHLRAVRQFVAHGRREAADAAVRWFLSLSEEDRKDLFR